MSWEEELGGGRVEERVRTGHGLGARTCVLGVGVGKRMRTGHGANGRMRMRAGRGVGRAGDRMPAGHGAGIGRTCAFMLGITQRGVGGDREIMGAPAAPVSARRVQENPHSPKQ